MTDLELRILRLIPVGANNPRAGRYIAKLVGIDIRTLRENVHRLIVKHGVPIVAKRGLVSGYYIPANDTERLEGIRELKAQYDTEGKRLDVLIKADLESYKKLLKGDDMNV
ncbi:TPA: DNA-binding protein [Streptococcus equi subsp. zooepidemicus]|nr:DNA-binding protein [Streptococcus equi subsp. zooepidemicus]HEL1084256.1 DNA-binding protein [Streptococcus equi subsp. zooepidemicus]